MDLMSRLTLQSLRRRKDIDSEVSIQQDLKNNEIRISSDCGRSTRPLYIVDYKKQNVLINGHHEACPQMTSMT